MKWTLISAVNDEEVLKSSLLCSPGLQSATEVILQKGYASAPLAYNAAIAKATTDLLVFVHQDIYLPNGWIESVEKAIDLLTKQDSDWGVLGVWGAIDSVQRIGYVWWTGDLGWEEPFEGVREVVSLDEIVLIFRKSSGLRFDDKLPGYHLYGADICLEAQKRRKKSYAIPAFCIHNTNTEILLPFQFWKCYWFMRRKWREQLPIDTPCTRINYSCLYILRWNLIAARDIIMARRKRLPRADCAAQIYRDLVARGTISPPTTT